jgi:hypothetical protein
MDELLKGLVQEFPKLTFKRGEDFCWSPREQIVYYTDSQRSSDAWTLLHETSHGILQHRTFESDFELLKLELAAWEKALQCSSSTYSCFNCNTTWHVSSNRLCRPYRRTETNLHGSSAVTSS